MYIIVRLLICIIMFSGAAARADEPCFTPRQSDAEAALRYQARLRVIGLLCNGPDGANLYKDYQLFTLNNAPVLQNDEQILLELLGDESEGVDEAGYPGVETEFQNREALAAANAGRGRFCRQHVPELKDAVIDSPVEVQRAIAQFKITEASPVKYCK